MKGDVHPLPSQTKSHDLSIGNW